MPTTTTFIQYIRQHASVPDTPTGDFVQDARCDSRFPEQTRTFKDVRMHLSDKSSNVLDAARSCWGNYKQYLRNHP